MDATERKTQGYVYILETKDMALPICKIGKTTRTPHARCEEINRNSSTGDLIWSVAYYIAVDDCDKLEELIHNKLSHSRHKGREIFNLDATTANKELMSILNNQMDLGNINMQKKQFQCKRTKIENAHQKTQLKRLLITTRRAISTLCLLAEL